MLLGDIYRKVYGTLFARPTNFGWFQEKKIAACGRPFSKKELCFLSNQGIKAILTLTEEPIPSTWRSIVDMQYKHIPMIDHKPPNAEQLDNAVKFLDHCVRESIPVAVHCAAGVGRTGSTLAAYLITRNHTAKEAIHDVRRVRPGSIEPQQADALEKYYDGRKHQRGRD